MTVLFAAEHEAIAEAIIRGDCQAAIEGLKSHLDYGKQSLLSPR